MRKKVKEAFSCEDGFTLVELLAVIVILGIIVAIAIPAVGSIIDRADSDADEAQEELIIDAARLYVTDKKPGELTFKGATPEHQISVADLLSEGYLEERGNEGSLEGYVSIKRTEAPSEGYKYIYEYFPKSVATGHQR